MQCNNNNTEKKQVYTLRYSSRNGKFALAFTRMLDVLKYFYVRIIMCVDVNVFVSVCVCAADTVESKLCLVREDFREKKKAYDKST